MEQTFEQRLGAAITTRRTALGLSRQKFAMMIGITRLTLRGIETGTGNPTLSNLRRVADGLDIPLSTLMLAADDDLNNTLTAALSTNAPRNMFYISRKS